MVAGVSGRAVDLYLRRRIHTRCHRHRRLACRDRPDGYDARGHDSGDTIGFFWTIGLEIPLGPRLAVFGEYNWTYARTDLTTDFVSFGEIDLGGEELALGLSFRF